jgi:hypothetical protein
LYAQVLNRSLQARAQVKARWQTFFTPISLSDQLEEAGRSSPSHLLIQVNNPLDSN